MTLLNTVLQNDTVKALVIDNHKSFVEYSTLITAITAIVAIIVSLVGFIYSVRYNRKSLKQSEEYNRKTLENTIRHNKLSVEPLLAFETINIGAGNPVEFILLNAGLGTAIIKSFEIIYNEKKYKDFMFVSNQKIITNKKGFVHVIMGENTAISSNARIPLINYKAVDINDYNFLCSVLDEIVIRIEYESMYGDKFVKVKD